jgi:hypothetical protein
MPAEMNIVDPFLFHARLNPVALAIGQPGAALVGAGRPVAFSSAKRYRLA